MSGAGRSIPAARDCVDDSLREIRASAARVLYTACVASEATWSDTAYKDGRPLRGVKFPLALMTEAALASRDAALLTIALKWQDVLACHYMRSGFNYFEAHYLPNDLDTASQVARVLKDHTPATTGELLSVAERHGFPRTLIPTWLDEANPERWFAGESAVHADVQVNFWRTVAGLGIEVPQSLVVCLLETFGLRNYWYFPPLYTAWQFSMFLAENPERVEIRTIQPLIEFVAEWDRRMMEPPGWASCCQVTRVRLLLQQDRATFLDAMFRQAIGLFLASIRRQPVDASVWPVLAARTKRWEAKVYWSIGFKAFGSSAVVAALTLLCSEQCGALLAASSKEQAFGTSSKHLGATMHE